MQGIFDDGRSNDTSGYGYMIEVRIYIPFL